MLETKLGREIVRLSADNLEEAPLEAGCGGRETVSRAHDTRRLVASGARIWDRHEHARRKQRQPFSGRRLRGGGAHVHLNEGRTKVPCPDRGACYRRPLPRGADYLPSSKLLMRALLLSSTTTSARRAFSSCRVSHLRPLHPWRRFVAGFDSS